MLSATQTKFNQNVKLVDSVELRLGDNPVGEDIYHDGSNSYIENEVGDLQIFNKMKLSNIYLQTMVQVEL